MIYCILGMIILSGNLDKATSQIPFITSHSGGSGGGRGRAIYCDTLSPSRVYCGIEENLTSMYPTIPIEKIPKQVKILDAHFLTTAILRITDHRMFKNFANLTELRLVGLVQFLSPYNEGAGKAGLMNELFNLPPLKSLELMYMDFRDHSSWKFSPSLESLTMQRCNLAQLDLTSNPNLTTLNLAMNNLKKMPQLFDPPPPLRSLVVSNNAAMNITVGDIASLCYLNELGVTGVNQLLDENQRYCECIRLKSFMKEFNIVEYDPLNCISSNADCSAYTLEAAKSIRGEKCHSIISTESSGSPGKALSYPYPLPAPESILPWLDANKVFLGIGVILLISLLANIILVVLVTRKGNQQTWDSAGSVVEEEEAEG